MMIGVNCCVGAAIQEGVLDPGKKFGMGSVFTILFLRFLVFSVDNVVSATAPRGWF